MNIARIDALRNEIVDEFGVFLNDSAKLLGTGQKAAGRRSRVSTNKLTKLFKQWRELTLEAGDDKK